MNSNEGYQRKNDRMRVRVKGEDKMRQSETTWSRLAGKVRLRRLDDLHRKA